MKRALFVALLYFALFVHSFSYVQADVVVLNPYDRTVAINEYYELGDFTGTALDRQGNLILGQEASGTYAMLGTWDSPIFDTQNQHVLWDWVYASANFAGMQENLMPYGDISSCGSSTPRACGFYYSNAQAPYLEEFDDSLAIRLSPTTSSLYDSYHVSTNSNDVFDIHPDKPLHILFDLKIDSDGSPFEFWLMLFNDSIPPGGFNTVSLYNGAMMRYELPIYDFEEQYYVVRFEQLTTGTARKAGIRFYDYYRFEDYPKAAWLKNIRMYQDSPITFQVRTSNNGLVWSDWGDERFFVAQRTDPGGVPARFIQFRVAMKRDFDVQDTPRLGSFRLDYSKAFPFEMSYLYEGPTIFDEEPADVANQGFVSVNSEGNMFFDDGSPAKFWATQATEEVFDFFRNDYSSMCRRIRQLGFNMVKITHMDTPAMDEFTEACKEHGVYMYAQLGGGIEHALFFDLSDQNSIPRYVERAQRFNTLTGIPYHSDPVFVFSQLFNEARLFNRWQAGGVWQEHHNHQLRTFYLYQEDFDASSVVGRFNLAPYANALWRNFLWNKYPTFESLSAAWTQGMGGGTYAFYGDESPTNYPSNIKITRFSDWASVSDKRFSDTIEYFASLYGRWYQESMDVLKTDIGLQSLLIANNHYFGLAELKERARVEVSDQHPYFGPMQTRRIGEWTYPHPQSRNPFDNMVTYTSLVDIKGLPITMSESNVNSPGVFSSELPLFISAYGSYHDWDAWFLFSTHRYDYSNPSMRISTHFDSWYAPERMAFMPAASRIFRYNYVTPGTQVIELIQSNNTVYNYKHFRGLTNQDYNVPGLHTDLSMVYRVRRADFDAQKDTSVQEYYDEYDLQTPYQIYVTPHEELYLDSLRGYFVVDAQKVQGFSGFTQPEPLELNYLEIFIPPKGNNYSTIVLIPLDDKLIGESEQLLLTASGRAQASNTKWAADKKGFFDDRHHHNLAHWGTPPMLVEGISADFSLVTSASQAAVYVIGAHGQRTGSTIPSELIDGKLLFSISDMDETLWYEIVLEYSIPDPDPDPDPVFLPGDLNEDGVVDLNDLYLVQSINDLVLVGKYFGTMTPHESFTKTFLVYYGGGASLTVHDVPWLAKYDLISIDRFRHHNINGDTWSAVKAVNPDIEFYLYQDSLVSNDNDHNTNYYLNNIARYNDNRSHSMGDLNNDNPDLFTTDAFGQRVYNTHYSNPPEDRYDFYMDFSNSSYSHYWLEATLSDIVDMPWVADGVFGDNLAPKFPSSLSEIPVQMPTEEEWTLAMEGHVQQITHGLHQRGQKLWTNRGNTRRQEGFDSWIAIDNSEHPPAVVMEEGAFVVKWGSSDAQFYPEQDWKRQVDLMGLINNSKVTYISHSTLAEGESGIDNHGEFVDYYQLLWYAVDSYYLGKNDNSYFMFHGAEGYSRNWWYDEYDYIDLGASVGTYQTISISGRNIYFREFEDGFVYVNPHRYDVSGIPLHEPLRMLNHDNFKHPESVSPITTMTLPRYTGTVLVR